MTKYFAINECKKMYYVVFLRKQFIAIFPSKDKRIFY
jgi:hypothetical protein